MAKRESEICDPGTDEKKTEHVHELVGRSALADNVLYDIRLYGVTPQRSA